MRCYFHVRGPDVEHLDANGVEVSDVNDAVAQAIEVVQELRDGSEHSERWDGWLLVISDDRGAVLSTIAL